jgi:gliding motility-associated-like protein
LFDPAYAEEGIHLISYTVSNALGCFSTAEISIEVLPSPDVVINPPGPLCVTGSPVQLTGSPPGGIWEGEITLGGIFDPANAGLGIHLITYTAEDSEGCSNAEQIAVEVVTAQIADITPAGPFCGTDTITLTANPPGGIWGGVANANGQILPNTQPEGSYPVTYQLNGTNECYNTEIFIDIVYADFVQCPNGPQLCTNADPVTLVAQPPGGVWSGAADATGLVDPSMLTPGLHMAIYTDSDLCNTGNSCWSYIEIFDAPSISNVSLDCDAQAAFYTVSFSILGGDTANYIVTGTTNGTIIPGTPYTFESDPIPTGSTYTFVVDDINQCYPDTISGTHLCNCSTDAGMMDVNPLVACAGETINILPPTGVILDPDDSLVYVLHLGFPDSIILVSDSLSFYLAPPLLPGTTYFISSVAGNASAGIGVDLNDPCLSVSIGTPVMWVAAPSGGIGGTTAVCEGDSATLTFFLTGTGPFDVTYSDGSNAYMLNNISPGYAIRVLPSVTTVYTLTDIAETIAPFCIGQPLTTHTVEVFQNYLIPRSDQICFGDSLLIGGAYQQVGGIYYDSLSTAQGCDSVLVTTLTINTLDTTYQTDKTCDPLQTGVFTAVLTDLNGCDSTIITTVTFALVDTTLIQSSTCDQQAAGIFSNLLAGQDGCDSLVIEAITYLPPDSTWISGVTCLPVDAGTFITIEMNAAGCDSFIIESILLIPSDTTVLAGETCDPASAGVLMQTFVNVYGCDSLVIETIALLPSDTIVLLQETCFPQEVGTEELVYTNIYGCDSVLWTITSLAPPDSCLEPVIHREIFIPNIFSPNGDGINDQFFISSHPEAIANIPFMRVYDRWGGLVFEGIGRLPNLPLEGWDGKVGGEVLNPGVFAWVAEVEYTDGLRETLFGDVSLVR